MIQYLLNLLRCKHRQYTSEAELHLVSELMRSLEGQTLNYLNNAGTPNRYNYNIQILDGRHLELDEFLDQVLEFDVELETGEKIEISRITYNNLILVSYVNGEESY